MIRSALVFSILCCLPLPGQEAPAPAAAPAGIQEAIPAEPPKPVIEDDASRVAVLGYHDFSETLKETAMRIRTSKFRSQMETIRQLGLPVISMEDFIAWKQGTKTIPEQAVVLTFDDGWRSVYTDAFPILKEFGYPFTLYLYKDYVDGGGKSLSADMIQEMMRHGATIGSHSVSHPYPQTIKGRKKKGEDAYDQFLRKEMGESKRFLESKFKTKVTTYCYPGGYHTEEMFGLAAEFGYQASFTVIPGKVKRSTANETVPRYVILGNHDSIFNMAMTFRDAASAPEPGSPLTALHQPTAHPVKPEPGTVVSSRLPVISADLSGIENLDPAKLVMRVSGFGEVPATFSPETKQLSWQVNRRIRQASCQVLVTWKDTAGKSTETPLRWSFQIDREAAYLPDGE